jgi:hypothetical protein
MNCKPIFYLMLTASVMVSPSAPAQEHAGDHPATVLHAAPLLDLDAEPFRATFWGRHARSERRPPRPGLHPATTANTSL